MMKITLYTEHYYLICNMKGSSGLIPETELSHYYFSYWQDLIFKKQKTKNKKQKTIAL